MRQNVFLAPLRQKVSGINIEIIDRLQREIEFMAEFLNSTKITDFPNHDLKLKNNTIIMLMRNLGRFRWCVPWNMLSCSSIKAKI